MPPDKVNEKILVTLEELSKNTALLGEVGKNNADELVRLREYKHKENDSLQNMALSHQEVRDNFTAQTKALEALKAEAHEERKELKEEMNGMRQIIAGPPDDPKKGMVFQVAKFQATVEGIHRALWLLVGGCLTISCGVLSALVLAYLKGKI